MVCEPHSRIFRLGKRLPNFIAESATSVQNGFIASHSNLMSQSLCAHFNCLCPREWIISELLQLSHCLGAASLALTHVNRFIICQDTPSAPLDNSRIYHSSHPPLRLRAFRILGYASLFTAVLQTSRNRSTRVTAEQVCLRISPRRLFLSLWIRVI